ncbi:MAG: hypothetical protein ACYDCO_15935 [Armatimonadota bacterium]
MREGLERLPGIAAFIQQIVYDIRNDRCVAIICPQEVTPDALWRHIREPLDLYQLNIREIDATKLTGGGHLLTALARALGVEWPSATAPRTLEYLWQAAGLPHIVYLRSLDSVADPMQWGKLWELCVQWARSNPRCVLVLCTQRADIPERVWERATDFAVHFWWGLPSGLDIQSLCRERAGTREPTVETRWCEVVTASLASGCASLVPCLMPVAARDEGVILDALRQYAGDRGWSPALLQQWGVRQYLQKLLGRPALPLSIPPYALKELWLRGVLCCTPEYGVEIHSAAVAALDDEGEIHRRLWRGQVAFLLPFLDHLRLGLCTMLSDRYPTRFGGQTWATCWEPPESAEERKAVEGTPLACQWGFLNYLLARAPHLRSEARYTAVAAHARDLRNALAHYRVVSFAAVRQLHQLAQQHGLLASSWKA